MNKRVILAILLLGVFLIAGCGSITGNVVKDIIVCEEPYIRYADSCCLDQNFNKICDNDEQTEVVGNQPYQEPGRFLPSSCSIAPGISCEEFAVVDSTNAITLKLRNGMGDALTSVSIIINELNTAKSICTLVCSDCISETTIPDGSLTTWISTECYNTGSSGSKFKANILFNYVGAGGLSHSKTGSITTIVK